MIAMALANEPDILIADEPTTALDVTIQAQILTLLKDLQARFGMALLLITHDLTIVRKMADRVAVMTQGEIVERGADARRFSARRSTPIRSSLLAAEPKGEPLAAGTAAPRRLLEAEDAQGLVPDQDRRAAPHDRLCQGGRRHRPRAARGRDAWASSASCGSGKTTLGLAMLRLIASNGAIRFDGIAHRATPQRRAAAAAARDADRVPGPVREPVAAPVGRRRSSRRG